MLLLDHSGQAGLCFCLNQSRIEWQLDKLLSGLQCKHIAEKPLQVVPEFMAY